MTQNVLCFGFEVAIKKCIMTYLLEKFENNNELVNLLEACFKSTMRADNKNMKEILYDIVAEDLVINSTSVFKNRSDEISHNLTSPKEIFTNYINLLMSSHNYIEDDSILMKI